VHTHKSWNRPLAGLLLVPKTLSLNLAFIPLNPTNSSRRTMSDPSGSTTTARESVLKPSDALPANAVHIVGPDLSSPVDLGALLGSYETIGFQATGLAKAIKVVEEMVRPGVVGGETHLGFWAWLYGRMGRIEDDRTTLGDEGCGCGYGYGCVSGGCTRWESRCIDGIRSFWTLTWDFRGYLQAFLHMWSRMVAHHPWK
jgi:hypothetical protein